MFLSEIGMGLYETEHNCCFVEVLYTFLMLYR